VETPLPSNSPHDTILIRLGRGTRRYIAKAIGPQDVLATLLNNLKVQERQNRVCTTVAIAIVAETCSPFTVLPALMNEYRVPELNVQVGGCPQPVCPTQSMCTTVAIAILTMCRVLPAPSPSTLYWQHDARGSTG
jgi:hypothetical protein